MREWRSITCNGSLLDEEIMTQQRHGWTFHSFGVHSYGAVIALFYKEPSE